MYSHIPPAIDQIVLLLFSHKDGFGIKSSSYAIKQRKQPTNQPAYSLNLLGI